MTNNKLDFFGQTGKNKILKETMTCYWNASDDSQLLLQCSHFSPREKMKRNCFYEIAATKLSLRKQVVEENEK